MSEQEVSCKNQFFSRLSLFVSVLEAGARQLADNCLVFDKQLFCRIEIYKPFPKALSTCRIRPQTEKNARELFISSKFLIVRIYICCFCRITS